MNRVVELEQATLDVLPAPEEDEIDGWRLRRGLGVIGRVNSATALGHLPANPDRAIAAAARWFRDRGHDPVFRLTRLDRELDRILDARGYRRSPDVLVMTRRAGGELDPGIRLDPNPDETWLEAYRRCGPHPPERATELARSLALLTLPHVVATLEDDAVAVAALRGQWVTVHSVAVDPGRRRRGLGARMTAGLVAWGAGGGADRAFLHVDGHNAPAVALHRSVGFRTHHRYWYRTSGA